MRILLIICAFLFRYCGEDYSVAPIPTPQRQRHAQTVFTLKLGQSVNIPSENLRLGFRDVISDSRCPKGVMCFWQGIADITLWLYRANTDTVFITPFIWGLVDRPDTTGKDRIDTLGVRITLMQLNPYPEHGVRIDKSDYSALLDVRKK